MQLKALPGTFYRAARLQVAQLSPKAQERLRLLRAWEALRSQGMSSTACSEVLAVPRATAYRWRRRLQRAGPQGLEEGSRCPKRKRRPTWGPELVQAVLDLRERYPRWGKSLP